jgi:site-specific DNA-methyltransferase (adenine-specific)
MIELHHIDCIEYMRELPDKCFELAIVDPPYGIGQAGASNYTRGKLATARNYKAFAGNDSEPPSEEYFEQLERVSINQIIWGANHFRARNSSAWIVWDKLNGASDFADAELAYTSFRCAVRVFRFRWAGMLQGNMSNKEERIHPTQKPVKLYEWLLMNYAKDGDRILDTHLGSGSSAIAAHNLGFDFIGCELDDHYFNAASLRLKQHQAQLQFWTDERA